MKMEHLKEMKSLHQLTEAPNRLIMSNLACRQEAANLIQDIGEMLSLSQLCINTAIVYMHRFYCHHTFTDLDKNVLTIAALFLAAKNEDQPCKLEVILKTMHVYRNNETTVTELDVKSQLYAEKQKQLLYYEAILLQTLGFSTKVHHPHPSVLEVCRLVNASKPLEILSYLLATTSLQMTTMCIEYGPKVISCVCVNVACKCLKYTIESSSNGKHWFSYVDRSVTLELLERLTEEFIAVLQASPHPFRAYIWAKVKNCNSFSKKLPESLKAVFCEDSASSFFPGSQNRQSKLESPTNNIKSPVSMALGKATVKAPITGQPEVAVRDNKFVSSSKDIHQVNFDVRFESKATAAQPKPNIKIDHSYSRLLDKTTCEAPNAIPVIIKNLSGSSISTNIPNQNSEIQPTKLMCKIDLALIPSLRMRCRNTVAPAPKQESFILPVVKPIGMSNYELPTSATKPAMTSDQYGSTSQKRMHESVDQHHEPFYKRQKIDHPSDENSPPGHSSDGKSSSESPCHSSSSLFNLPYMDLPSLSPF